MSLIIIWYFFHRPGSYDSDRPPGGSRTHLSAHIPCADLRINGPLRPVWLPRCIVGHASRVHWAFGAG